MEAKTCTRRTCLCGLWASRGCEMLPLLLLVHDFSWVADNSIPVWVSDS